MTHQPSTNAPPMRLRRTVISCEKLAALFTPPAPSTAVAVSLDPRVVHLLTVGFVMRTENEKLKTIGACLKGADDLRRDPDRVEHPDVADLVIELDSPSAGKNHVHLLSARVAMSERRTFPGPNAKVRHPRLVSLEIHAGHAGPPPISEAARRRRVLDIGQVDLRVGV
jgi:hypothetical protein